MSCFCLLPKIILAIFETRPHLYKRYYQNSFLHIIQRDHYCLSVIGQSTNCVSDMSPETARGIFRSDFNSEKVRVATKALLHWFKTRTVIAFNQVRFETRNVQFGFFFNQLKQIATSMYLKMNSQPTELSPFERSKLRCVMCPLNYERLTKIVDVFEWKAQCRVTFIC